MPAETKSKDLMMSQTARGLALQSHHLSSTESMFLYAHMKGDAPRVGQRNKMEGTQRKPGGLRLSPNLLQLNSKQHRWPEVSG